MAAPHVPDRGQIVTLDFEPTVGREIGKSRPALVLSPKAYNRLTGLVVVCPVTSKISGYPFEVPLPPGRVAGAVLADRVHNLDWRARRCVLVERVPGATLTEVRSKLDALLG